MKRIAYLILLLLVAIPLTGCTGGDGSGTGVEPVPPKVKVVRIADRVGVHNKIEVSGHIEPNLEALLSSDFNARVTALHVSLNENVTKGELLVELDARPEAAALQHVISPIDGRVVELFMEKGERIREGDELLRIKNMSSVRVVFKVHAMHYGDIRVGQGVRMSVPGLPGLNFIGSVYSIARMPDEPEEAMDLAENGAHDEADAVDTSSAPGKPGELGVFDVSSEDGETGETVKTVKVDPTFEVQAMVRNPRGKLEAGLKADAIIDTGITKDVYIIPSSALVKILEKEVLYVVEDDLAVEREVLILRRRDDTVHVLEGLDRGDLLIVDNAENVTNEAKVIIID